MLKTCTKLITHYAHNKNNGGLICHILKEWNYSSVWKRDSQSRQEWERGEDKCLNPRQEWSLKVDEHKQTLFVLQSTLQLISPWLARRSNRGERNECELYQPCTERQPAILAANGVMERTRGGMKKWERNKGSSTENDRNKKRIVRGTFEWAGVFGSLQSQTVKADHLQINGEIAAANMVSVGVDVLGFLI